MLPAMKQSAEITQPREQALDLPAAHVATQNAPVLGLGRLAIAAVRSNQFNALLLKHHIEFVAVIGFIADQPSRSLSKKRLLKGSLDKGDFMRRSTFCVNGDRKTIAVRHCHDLGPLATLGFANTSAPFFAATKVASMKHSDRSSLPRLRRSSASASKTTRSVPARTHAWKRLWQVWYGYASAFRKSICLLWVRAVKRRRFSSGCESHPATAPAGSNRRCNGGNEVAEAVHAQLGLPILRIYRYPDSFSNKAGETRRLRPFHLDTRHCVDLRNPTRATTALISRLHLCTTPAECSSV